jgi:uncharacterized protein YlzI (FlbEa/FlbD family)
MEDSCLDGDEFWVNAGVIERQFERVRVVNCI